ncbi:MAG: rRNA methyltransferase [Frankiales bacterium]|nr:rRNA methyltransferase [Frankiales bacterium]
MAQRVDVVDPHDPRLSDYTGLTDVALRSVREPAEGLFLGEGEKVVRRALAAGYRPRSLLTAAKWLPSLEDALAGHDCPVFVADDDVLRAVTGYRVHRGVLASLERRPLPSLTDLVAPARRVVVLEDLVDHTNVGAVFRNAAALGFDAVVVSPGCADPLYRRSVKVSMGTVLAVPWTRAEAWPDALDTMRHNGFRLVAMSPDPSGTALPAADLRGRVAVLLGTEGDGLSAAALERCDERVRIPMAAGVDSLNVAAASAVVLYAVGAADDMPGLAGSGHG